MQIVSPRISTVKVFSLAISIVAFLLLLWAVMPRVNAANVGQGEKLITIHDRGEERGFITDAKTLREAFDEKDIILDNNDIVEPGLDEQLTSNNYQVNVYRARPVVIVDGQVQQLVMSAYQTPKQVAAHAGITLRDEDRAELSLTTNMVRDGASVRMTIDRATGINLTLYGKSETVYTQASTVADFMKEKNIKLGPKDDMSVDESTPVTEGLRLSIWRNGKQTVTKEEPVKFDTQTIQDSSKPTSFREVNEKGVPGTKMVTYEIVMKDGKEVSRKAIQTVVTKQPVKEVVTVGSKPSFSGDFAAALAKLRACESGGNYSNKNNPLYRGAYQYSYSTWGNKYGIYDPADASPAQQDQAARETYERRGWQPWPHCGSSLPDTFR